MPRLGPVLLLVLVLAGCGEPAGEDRPRPTTSLRVRVMSFNLRWDGFGDGENAWAQRRDLVVQVLRDFAPDSVGTQEPMKRQIRDIQRALPNLASHRFDNDPVYVRTQQILYRADRFERADAGGFLVSDGRNEDGTVRYCTWVRLTERATGRSYRHYNVHLDHRHATSRRQAVVRLMQHIAAHAGADPFVLTGDFNAGEDSPALAFLRGERALPGADGSAYVNPRPLVDTHRLRHPEAAEVGTAGGFGGRRGGPKIDFVLIARGAATVHEAAIVRTSASGRYPSDHFPVTAVLTWP